MGKKRRKRKKGNGSFVKKVLLIAAVALTVGACIRHNSDGEKLVSQVGKMMEQAKEVVEQAREEVNRIQKQAEQHGNTAIGKQTETNATELPAKRKQDTRILERTGYTLSYNDEWKIPNWVAWKLTSERVGGKVKRTDFFEADPDLPARVRSEHRDYSGSRYDRGHMAPAGDMKWDEQAMVESFYMSNMCPQAPNLNKGDWRILEEQCRKWAQRHGTLFIACGPIVDKRLSSKKRIGRNKVLVPDGFFKVVLKLGKHPAAVGFLFPNDDCDAPLKHYAVTVDSVENLTGINFFHHLPDEQENLLEATNGMSHF